LQQVSTAGGEMTALQAGEGPDLVVLHSLLADRTAFDAVLPALAERYRVTILNLPGFHGSVPVEASLEAHVAWMARAFDGFGIGPRATLLGNGFGGTLALAFALDYPKRLGQLVVCDAAAGFPEPGKQAFRMMAEKVAAGGVETIVEIAANRVYHPAYLAAHPNALEERRKSLLAIDPQAFEAACRLLVGADLLPRLSGLKVPTLVICGALDQATPPPLNRAIAEAVPGTPYVEIPECGHCPPLENPRAFLEALRAHTIL
jgi:3-oxoadipate enol-lactonase